MPKQGSLRPTGGIAAGAALIALVAATAARADGFYFGGEGGWTVLEDAIAHRTNGSAAIQVFRDGYNVGGRAGYEWGAWRVEGEFSLRRNRLDAATHEISPPGPLSPTLRAARGSYAEMVNVIYDVPLGWPVSPHLGVGAGAAQTYLHASIPVVGTTVDSTDTVFAYQAIAGLRYDINPNLEFDIDYRYFATATQHFTAEPRNAGNTQVTGVGIKADYQSHNLVASLIVKFEPPPAPPPIAAAPVMGVPSPATGARVFLVFFDWDRDAISRDGMRIIEQAEAAYRAGGSVRIQVTGYTDRSGSPGYNQRLSERRANNVAVALVRLGVPRNDMAVGGRGESDNRVPTAAGVREPQNRRVEIGFP